mgnify:CR=1 FL=1
MDFFDHQDAARTRTRRLVLYFVLAVFSIIVAIYLTVVLLYSGAEEKPGMQGATDLWDPVLFAAVAIGTVMVVAGGSLYKINALSDGGDAVARLLGGRPMGWPPG